MNSSIKAARRQQRKEQKQKVQQLKQLQQQEQQEQGQQQLVERKESFLTAPDDGWLHNKFAMQYGEGVFFSFPVTFVGRHPIARSLRSVEFPVRNKLVREAICRVREEARTRPSIERQVPAMFSEFLDKEAPDSKMEDIVLNISTKGIVLATEDEDSVIAYHRMPTISFAAGGDFEDYDMVAYVAKSRLGRMCYVFDCGAFSNQVLATIGQAFVQAGEQAEAQEYEEFDDEFGVYAQQAMTEQEYQDLYGTVAYQDVSGDYAGAAGYRSASHEYAALDGVSQRQSPCYHTAKEDSQDPEYALGVPEANPDYAHYTLGVEGQDPDYDMGVEGQEPDYDMGMERQEPDYDMGVERQEPDYDMGVERQEPDYDVGVERQEPDYDVGVERQEPDYDVGVEGQEPDYDMGVEAANSDYHRVAIGKDGVSTYDTAMQAAESAHTYAMGNECGQGDGPTYNTATDAATDAATSPTYAAATDFPASPTYVMASDTYATAGEMKQTPSQAVGTGADEARTAYNATYGTHGDTSGYTKVCARDKGKHPDADGTQEPTYTLGQTDELLESVTDDMETYDTATQQQSTQQRDSIYATACAVMRQSSAVSDGGEEQEERVYNNRSDSFESVTAQQHDDDDNDDDATYDMRTVQHMAASTEGDIPNADAAFGQDDWQELQNKGGADRNAARDYDPRIAGSYTDGEYLEEYTPAYLEVGEGGDDKGKGKGKRFLKLFARKKGNGKTKAGKKSKKQNKLKKNAQPEASSGTTEHPQDAAPAERLKPVVYEDPAENDTADGGCKESGAYTNIAAPSEGSNSICFDDNEDDSDGDSSSTMTTEQVAAMYSTVSRQRGNPPAVPPKRATQELIRSSIRSKPLQGKADFLVRKLNAEAGSLSMRERQHRCERAPSWNFIDPDNLNRVQES